MRLTPSTVSFDESPTFPCLLHCNTWNGWAMPYFTKEQADVIVASGVGPFVYDAATDSYSYTPDDFYPEDVETYEAIEYEGQKVYGIGAGSLCWNYPDADPWLHDLIAGAWKMLRGYMHILWQNDRNADNCPALKAVFRAEGQETDEDELRKVLALAYAAAEDLGLSMRDDLRSDTLAIVKGENPFA